MPWRPRLGPAVLLGSALAGLAWGCGPFNQSLTGTFKFPSAQATAPANPQETARVVLAVSGMT